MRRLFKSKERFSLGLDIGTSTVKLVKLKFSKEGAEFCDFNLEPINAGLSQVLKAVTQRHQMKMVNVSVSGPAAVIRYANFPRMSLNELLQALKFESQEHIPFAVSEANLDASILKSDLPDNKMLVLLAAVKKEFLSQRLAAVQEAGLDVNSVDIDSIALINAFNFNYSGDDNLNAKTIALLNIGSSFTNLNILEDNAPRLSRDIQIAGNTFTQKLADTFGLDFNSAQGLKLNPDKERLQAISAAVEAVLSDLANEVRQSFDYYESQSTFSVERIFLSGAGSNFPGLKDMLANLLGIEAEFWDPLRKINISDNIASSSLLRINPKDNQKTDSQKIMVKSSDLAVAIGLALRF